MLLGIPCCFSMGLTCWFKHGSFSLATSWFHPSSYCMFAATQTNTLKLHSIGNICCHIMADLVLASASCFVGEALKSNGLLLLLTVFSTQGLCFVFVYLVVKWDMWCNLCSCGITILIFIWLFTHDWFPCFHGIGMSLSFCILDISQNPSVPGWENIFAQIFGEFSSFSALKFRWSCQRFPRFSVLFLPPCET